MYYGVKMPKKSDKPTAAQFGTFRSRMAQLGISAAQMNTAVGATVNGRTWEQIADKLIAWLKTLPKA